jgi:hypothetical protein
MASQRQPATPGAVEEVDPSVEGGEVSPGVTTMAEMFGQPQIVDEVQELPIVDPLGEAVWIVRPSMAIEDMTVGLPENHFNMKAGTRYRVPARVAEILYNRDQLMEVPIRYDDAALQRR